MSFSEIKYRLEEWWAVVSRKGEPITQTVDEIYAKLFAEATDLRKYTALVETSMLEKLGAIDTKQDTLKISTDGVKTSVDVVATKTDTVKVSVDAVATNQALQATAAKQDLLKTVTDAISTTIDGVKVGTDKIIASAATEISLGLVKTALDGVKVGTDKIIADMASATKQDLLKTVTDAISTTINGVKVGTDKIIASAATAANQALQATAAKQDLQATAAKQDTEKTSIDAIKTSVDAMKTVTDGIKVGTDKIIADMATETSLGLLKTDIADMKGLIGETKGIKVFSVLEIIGGTISLNQVDSLALVTSTATNYELLKTINISTPTPPTGVTIYKYALMVSFDYHGTNATYNVYAKVDVDNIELNAVTKKSTATTIHDKSKMVTTGAHVVKVYGKVVAGVTVHIENVRVLCGVGTISLTSEKVADIATAGQTIIGSRFGSKSYEVSVTVTGIVKPDEDPADYTLATQAITLGGSLYENSAGLTTYTLVHSQTYAYTSNVNIPCFITYTKVKTLKSYTM